MTEIAALLTADVERRFWEKVDRGDLNQCWPWIAHVDRHGYGGFSLGGKTIKSHRVSAAIDGRDPGALCVLHSCDNPPCCNPHHLFVGTQTENIADATAKGRMARGDTNGNRTKPESRPRGESHTNAKLTEANVAVIRSSEKPQHLLANEFGVSVTTISYVQNRKKWRHVL